MINGLAKLKKQFDVLFLSQKQRRAIHAGAGKLVKKSSQQRIQQQRDLRGKPFTPRKNKARKKMLRGLKKRIVVIADQKKADITFRNGITGRIAREQQDGVDRQMSVTQLRGKQGAPNYDGPATRKQAKALRAEGYKVKRAGGRGHKTPTVKWITENLTLGQAGLITQLLRGGSKKQRWTIPLPARSFLGATKKEIDRLLDDVTGTLLQQMKRA